MNRRELGQRGEDLACRVLKKKGYRIIDRNVRLPGGELDVIARFKKTLVFVEVKTRTSTAFGAPQEAVDRRKQERLTRLAWTWLKQEGLEDSPARFDVVSILVNQDGDRARVEVFENAFEARGQS